MHDSVASLRALRSRVCIPVAFVNAVLCMKDLHRSVLSPASVLFLKVGVWCHRWGFRGEADGSPLCAWLSVRPGMVFSVSV